MVVCGDRADFSRAQPYSGEHLDECPLARLDPGRLRPLRRPARWTAPITQDASPVLQTAHGSQRTLIVGMHADDAPVRAQHEVRAHCRVAAT